MIGGIDLGGTKIEARVFNDALMEVGRNRIATPTGSYDSLLDGLAAQVSWLEDQGQMDGIGLGTPGLINPRTGVMLTANLPATGQRLQADISERVKRNIAVINDCRAFTLSEATQGAGKGHRNVVGLVIGTGVAGGQAIGGHILGDKNGQHGEFGHLPIPAAFIGQYKLPLLACGCGLTGCFETYLSGPGLVRLAEQLTGQKLTAAQVLSDLPAVRAAWIDLTASLVGLISRTSDPDVIVLGGGLGILSGLPEEIAAALPAHLLKNTEPPGIVPAQHGDASGALGAALFALQASA